MLGVMLSPLKPEQMAQLRKELPVDAEILDDVPGAARGGCGRARSACSMHQQPVLAFLPGCGDGILPGMTIGADRRRHRALPLTDRLRVIELVAREAASDVPAADHPARCEGVTLTERHGLLLVDADATMPAEVFDHRPDRDARADRIQGES